MSYVKQVAEAVRDAVKKSAFLDGLQYEFICFDSVDLDEVIASVPLPEPVGYKVTGVSTIYYDKADAEAEAKHCGGTTTVTPLYADPVDALQAIADFGQLQTALEQIAEAQAGWQPIETAPKDGIWFLAWRKYAIRPMFAKWNTSFQWFENEDRDHLYDLESWMPLPATPEVKGGA